MDHKIRNAISAQISLGLQGALSSSELVTQPQLAGLVSQRELEAKLAGVTSALGSSQVGVSPAELSGVATRVSQLESDV